MEVKDSVAVLLDVSTCTVDNVELPPQKGYRPMKQVLEYGEEAPYDTRFPAYIIEGLIISFMLVIIAVVGIVCTCQIQTPEAFEVPHKHRD